jgi:hypothetical protein
MNLKETEVEQWAEVFDKVERVDPLKDNNEAQFHILHLRSHEEEIERSESLRKGLKSGVFVLASAIYNRIENSTDKFSFHISVAAALALGGLLGNFAEATMMVAYLAYKAKERKWHYVGMPELMAAVISRGIPTEKEFYTMWRLQKLDQPTSTTDNGLDVAINYQSLKF